MRAVNLLPDEAARNRRRAQERMPLYAAAGAAVVVAAILAGSYLQQSAKVADAQQQFDAAAAQLASTPVPPPPPKPPVLGPQPTVITQEQQPRLDALSTALSQRIAWDRILREFSLVLPPDVWLTQLSLTAPSSTGTSGLSLSGSTYSYDGVARLVSRLQLVPDLTNVQVGSSGQKGRLVAFSLTADVKGAPVPATTTTETPAPAPTDTTGDSGA